ncbi:hypothetical protein ACHAWF_018163 [Thalassiosira exigua]
MPMSSTLHNLKMKSFVLVNLLAAVAAVTYKGTAQEQQQVGLRGWRGLAKQQTKQKTKEFRAKYEPENGAGAEVDEIDEEDAGPDEGEGVRGRMKPSNRKKKDRGGPGGMGHDGPRHHKGPRPVKPEYERDSDPEYVRPFNAVKQKKEKVKPEGRKRKGVPGPTNAEGDEGPHGPPPGSPRPGKYGRNDWPEDTTEDEMRAKIRPDRKQGPGGRGGAVKAKDNRPRGPHYGPESQYERPGKKGPGDSDRKQGPGGLGGAVKAKDSRPRGPRDSPESQSDRPGKKGPSDSGGMNKYRPNGPHEVQYEQPGRQYEKDDVSYEDEEDEEAYDNARPPPYRQDNKGKETKRMKHKMKKMQNKMKPNKAKVPPHMQSAGSYSYEKQQKDDKPAKEPEDRSAKPQQVKPDKRDAFPKGAASDGWVPTPSPVEEDSEPSLDDTSDPTWSPSEITDLASVVASGDAWATEVPTGAPITDFPTEAPVTPHPTDYPTFAPFDVTTTWATTTEEATASTTAAEAGEDAADLAAVVEADTDTPTSLPTWMPSSDPPPCPPEYDPGWTSYRTDELVEVQGHAFACANDYCNVADWDESLLEEDEDAHELWIGAWVHVEPCTSE